MALGYLISPVIQIENTNGMPLTGGFLRVYLAGTTVKAVTYRDFDGNKNPNDVVLDSKGMAVLIAEEGLYDVYCYDRHGVQQWSRRRLTTCGGTGGDIRIDMTVPFFKGKGVDDLWYNYEGGQVEINAFDTSTMSTAFPDGTFGTVPACNDPETFRVETISGQPRLLLYKPGVYVVRALIHFKWAGTPVAEFARVDGQPFDLSYQHTDSHEKQANIINNGRETPIMCTLVLPSNSFVDVPESGLSVRCQSITIERLGDYVEPVVGE
jgi:hypothetical protein